MNLMKWTAAPDCLCLLKNVLARKGASTDSVFLHSYSSLSGSLLNYSSPTRPLQLPSVYVATPTNHWKQQNKNWVSQQNFPTPTLTMGSGNIWFIKYSPITFYNIFFHIEILENFSYIFSSWNCCTRIKMNSSIFLKNGLLSNLI